MFSQHIEGGYKTLLDGIEMKTLVHGEKTLMSEFYLHKGFTLPLHSHPHEQTGYLVKGHLLFHAAGEEIDARPGDSWCIPGGIEHGASILEDTIAIEVFSPVREDYLP
jgi:quercetin dioxygenase-like cupin family protein